jgi:hypothetical protein
MIYNPPGGGGRASIIFREVDYCAGATPTPNSPTITTIGGVGGLKNSTDRRLARIQCITRKRLEGILDDEGGPYYSKALLFGWGS